jgi:hypothetical protein
MSAQINAFLAGRQLRNDEEDRQTRNALLQEERGMRNTQGKVNALLMTGDREGAQTMAAMSGDPDVMQTVRAELTRLDDREREQRQQRLQASIGVAGTILNLPEDQRAGWVMGEGANVITALGIDPQEIVQRGLSDQNIQAYIGGALNMNDELFVSNNEAYTLGENDTRVGPGGRQTIGQAGSEARDLERDQIGVNRQNADSRRLTAQAAANRETRRANQQPAPVLRTVNGTLYDVSDPANPRPVIEGEDIPQEFSEGQAQTARYANRMQAAHDIANRLETSGEVNPSARFRARNVGVPFLAPNLGDAARGDSVRQYDQARQDFVMAILRDESGAAISESELQQALETYFPVPGDGERTVAQKRTLRERAVNDMRASSQGAYEALITPTAPQRVRSGFASDAEYDAYIDSLYE